MGFGEVYVRNVLLDWVTYGLLVKFLIHLKLDNVLDMSNVLFQDPT